MLRAFAQMLHGCGAHLGVSWKVDEVSFPLQLWRREENTTAVVAYVVYVKLEERRLKEMRGHFIPTSLYKFIAP